TLVAHPRPSDWVAIQSLEKCRRFAEISVHADLLTSEPWSLEGLVEIRVDVVGLVRGQACDAIGIAHHCNRISGVVVLRVSQQLDPELGKSNAGKKIAVAQGSEEIS